MKKLTLLTILLLATTIAVAQDNDKEPVFPQQDPLPEAGDYSLGFDAVPLMEYFGNIFNGTQGNSIGAEYIGNNQQVFGKYFLTDDMAVRARVRLNRDAFTTRQRVVEDNQDAFDPNVQVVDKRTDYTALARLGGGLEFRQGEGRLVGVYGGEASLLYGSSSSDYEYGNPMTEDNQQPTSAWGTGAERPTDERHERRFGFGLNAFAGVEYFIAPKISLGAEFTWGMDFLNEFQGRQTSQYWDAGEASVESRETVTEGDSFFSLDTGNYSGAINLMFYF